MLASKFLIEEEDDVGTDLLISELKDIFRYYDKDGTDFYAFTIHPPINQPYYPYGSFLFYGCHRDGNIRGITTLPLSLELHSRRRTDFALLCAEFSWF